MSASDVYKMRPLYALCFKDVFEDFLKMLKEERLKNSSATPWDQSSAKKLLWKDLLDGTASLKNNEMDRKVVYEMRPECLRYLYNIFKPNLKSLRVKIIDDNQYAEFDNEALKHDRLIYPIE
jgi:hypothetical protein